MCFGVHEAAHFVIACRLGLYPHDAYVRVPKKSPKALSVFVAGGPGFGGLVSVSGTTMQDAAVGAAGAIAQCFLPNYAERICADDWATADRWVNESGVPGGSNLAFLDAVTSMVDLEWKVIDSVAACLLHYADATGYLSSKLTARLNQLVRSTPADIARAPEFRFPPILHAIPENERPSIHASRDYPFVDLTVAPSYRSWASQNAGPQHAHE